jgi:very-short-patch-repair endonuclease
MANEIARALRKRLTPQEAKLWVQLRLLEDFHFRRQVPIGPYIVDFAEKTKRVAIEVDGSQHNQPEGLARDAKRDLYLRNNRYNVLRFWNADIDTNMSGVIDTILLALQSSLPPR